MILLYKSIFILFSLTAFTCVDQLSHVARIQGIMDWEIEYLREFEGAVQQKAKPHIESLREKISRSNIDDEFQRSVRILMEAETEKAKFRLIAKRIREVPNLTPESHLEVFSAFVSKHLDEAKRTLEGRFQGDELTRKLNVLNWFTLEARNKQIAEEVTYDWWIGFNHRLSILKMYEHQFTPQEMFHSESQFNFELRALYKRLTDSEENWIREDAYERSLREVAQETNSTRFSFFSINNSFPDIITIPSIDNGGLVQMPSIGHLTPEGIYPIGIANTDAHIDSVYMNIEAVFRHDIIHVDNTEYALGIGDISRKMTLELQEFYHRYIETLDLEERVLLELGLYFVQREQPANIGFIYRGLIEYIDLNGIAIRLTREEDFGSDPIIPSYYKDSVDEAQGLVNHIEDQLKSLSRRFQASRNGQ